MKYDGSVEDAIEMQNNVPQGLSSAIMTSDLKIQKSSCPMGLIAVLQM